MGAGVEDEGREPFTKADEVIANVNTMHFGSAYPSGLRLSTC